MRQLEICWIERLVRILAGFCNFITLSCACLKDSLHEIKQFYDCKMENGFSGIGAQGIVMEPSE